MPPKGATTSKANAPEIIPAIQVAKNKVIPPRAAHKKTLTPNCRLKKAIGMPKMQMLASSMYKAARYLKNLMAKTINKIEPKIIRNIVMRL
jgi:hypothetical protein